jgi:hypothetical protein
MRRVLFAIVFMAASAGQSWADDSDIRTGEQLLDKCQSSEAPEISSCRNYVTGAVETILLIRAQTFDCYFIPPDGFTEDQAIGAVVEYLKARPDQRTMSGARNVMDAMVTTYPCPK